MGERQILLLEATIVISSYEDQNRNSMQVLWSFQVLPILICTEGTNTQLNGTRPSKSSQPWSMQNSNQRIIHHIGIIPIPPPPRPPRDPPRLAGPPPKLLPLLLLLAGLLFVTPAEALPLPVLPDDFLFFFHTFRELPRPLLPPRLFELS